jgi:hypothetical protein
MYQTRQVKTKAQKNEKWGNKPAFGGHFLLQSLVSQVSGILGLVILKGKQLDENHILFLFF